MVNVICIFSQNGDWTSTRVYTEEKQNGTVTISIMVAIVPSQHMDVSSFIKNPKCVIMMETLKHVWAKTGINNKMYKNDKRV